MKNVKSHKQNLQDILIKKQIEIVTQIFVILQKSNLSQKDLAEKLGVKESYLSQVLTGYRTNLTLKTIANFELALEEIVLTTPLEHEYQLISNPKLLVQLVNSVLESDTPEKKKLLDSLRRLINETGFIDGFKPIELGTLLGDGDDFQKTEKLYN